MSGVRGAWGRVVAIGATLAVAALLLSAAEASAAKYAVAQCGWFVGADANWADTTGGVKFRSDAYCVPPPGFDAFDGVHMKSFTRDGQGTVTGTRFARWRWEAPPWTGITAVRGTWWHALHDGMEQRLGGVNWAGAFAPSLAAEGTDTALRDFSIGFDSPVPAFEDRLLCARGEAKWCSLERGSWSGLRTLTLTVEDNGQPVALLSGGELVSGGWRRGDQSVFVGAGDVGGGIRFGETFVDGNRVGFTEYPCNKASIDGEWRATTMRPCASEVATTHYVATASLSDGLHTVAHCAADFAGTGGCTGIHHFLVDNNPPAHPRGLTLHGGVDWRRVNDFDLVWENSDQAPGSPIAGASWRLLGGAGFETGVRFAAGRNRRSLGDLSVPAAGTYALQLWLRDEAGNEASASALTVPLRFDDVRPGVSFAMDAAEGQVRADVLDVHSGPAAGQLLYRRLDAEEWIDLPARLVPGNATGVAHLVAPMPDLANGTYVFRADVVDAAGNIASTSLRADGTQMAVRAVPPPQVAPPAPQRVAKGKARLFARLLAGRGGDRGGRDGRGGGDVLTVPFGAAARIGGRLTRDDGAGLGNRALRVVSRPSEGALAPIAVETVRTGAKGGFDLELPPGSSRRVGVTFVGDDGFEPARRAALELRVRTGISLRAVPLALRTGEAVKLSGRIRTMAASLPRRGKLVAIQYLEEATQRWRPVLVTHSDHRGRYRARYLFRYVTGRASIRLRATALAEERWPYAPGFSTPVTVRVRG
jgi:hypothetical protein